MKKRAYSNETHERLVAQWIKQNKGVKTKFWRTVESHE